MSLKTKIAAGVATFGLVGGGLAMAGTMTASAATPNCGGNCTNLFSQKYGPQYLVDVWQAQAVAGQPVILFQKSNSDPAEDFVVVNEGTVRHFYNRYGLVTPAFAHTYAADTAYEVQYEPYGLNSNFCLSTWPGEAPQAGWKVRLENCGATSSSLWAADEDSTTRDFCSTGSVIAGTDEDVPLISGAGDNFSNPEVLNYPAGNPTDMPRPQLNVEPEKTYSTGTVFDNQQWGTTTGAVASGSGRACAPRLG
jgi:hypothetical protein